MKRISTEKLIVIADWRFHNYILLEVVNGDFG
jgi:hypothetical protein